MRPRPVTRIVMLVAVLLLGFAVLTRASRMEPVPIRESLEGFPYQLGPWEGRPAPEFEARILRVLGVDEYVNRVYYRGSSAVAGLYVGYYQSQRHGDTMHSPLNCLPGAGWQPIRKARRTITVDENGQPRAIEVNSFVIEKGIDRQVVIYWYQGHGRVVASEYWGKIYTVLDALRYNRTDGALVRVVVPIAGEDAAAAAVAEQQGIEFVQALFPVLHRYLPS